MRYKIFDNGKQINTIEADFLFAAAYCQSDGYTFEEDSLPEFSDLEPPTADERVAKLENENSKLKSQIQMQAQQQEFLENCLLEMGDVVYA